MLSAPNRVWALTVFSGSGAEPTAVRHFGKNVYNHFLVGRGFRGRAGSHPGGGHTCGGGVTYVATRGSHTGGGNAVIYGTYRVTYGESGVAAGVAAGGAAGDARPCRTYT